MMFEFNGQQISIDKSLAHKLDKYVDRITKFKRDGLILIDGAEGYGKSNIAAIVCAYIASKTQRELSVDNCFFNIDDMLKYATKTEKKIVWWDEAALGGLARESYAKTQLKLLKLLYVARKKQHFFVFCIPKMYRLTEPIVDRALGLIHVYSPDEIKAGFFAYYRKKSKEALYSDWKNRKKVNYKLHYDIRGTFSESLYKVIDENKYESKKDAAILTISQEQDVKIPLKYRKTAEQLQIVLSNLGKVAKRLNMTQTELAEHIGLSRFNLIKRSKPQQTELNVAVSLEDINNYVINEQENESEVVNQHLNS